MQDAIQEKDDILLKAATGLEGGCVANGSTCGIATGGALSIALMVDQGLQKGEAFPERAVLESVGGYLDWFKREHGTTQCRERNNVDFHKVSGQLKYFLSSSKMLRCMLLTGSALNHLTLNENFQVSCPDKPSGDIEAGASIHCARNVLESVRERTGIGNDRLERLSIVFDGGVGLRGVLCGALSGAILALNLLHGFNLRQMSYSSNFKKFLIGHINLLREKSGRSIDTFFIGKQMTTEFKENAGSIECSTITGRTFENPEDFSEYIETSEPCRNLIRISADIAVKAIEETRNIVEFKSL